MKRASKQSCSKTFSPRAVRNFVLAATVLWSSLASTDVASAEMPALSGRITSASNPLEAATIYAYQLADLTVIKVATSIDGNFEFDQLPAGLFRIIALKPGFSPAVIGLTRASEGASQFLELELMEAAPGETSLDSNDFWELRAATGSMKDQLRGDTYSEQVDRFSAPGGQFAPLPETRFSAEMSATTGVDQRSPTSEAQIRGGNVHLQGERNALSMDVTGDFRQLEPTTSSNAFSSDGLATTGQSSRLSIEVQNDDRSRVYLTSRNNEMMDMRDGRPSEVGFENYQIGWSQKIGKNGRSDISAQYTAENNFLRQGTVLPGPFLTASLPDESRAWHVEGSFTGTLTNRNSLKTGFRYSEGLTGLNPLSAVENSNESLLPQQTIEAYGLGGYQASRTTLLEYGLYSTLRDGSLTLAPRAGVVVQLGDQWQAAASATHSVRNGESRNWQTFAPAYYYEFDTCELAEEYCYEFKLSREWDDSGSLSVSTVHRKFDEPLRLFFNENFFDHFESLYMVEGDALPQVQVAATHRVSPRVLTRFESNIGSGGGGTLYAQNASYENDVAYVVTSLDTQFERTATGVFFAFHRLEQELQPLEQQAAELALEQIKIERLQFMLTQDLNLLFDVAANWAVHLNMELSRGGNIETDSGYEVDEEFRHRFTGGIAVKF